MKNNDMTGLLNLAYEIEGLLMLHINRGDEASAEMTDLLVRKARQLAEGLEESAAPDLDIVPETAVAVEESAPVPAPAHVAAPVPEVAAEAEEPATEAEKQTADAETEEVAESARFEEAEDAGEEPAVLTLDEKLARERATDISKAFTLNDRFRFCRELFRNSNEEFRETIEVIGTMSDMDEAEEYFYNDLCWDPEKEEVKEFMAIVAKHF